MLLADLDLPTLELAQPGMVGQRLHDTLAAARDQSWIARNNAGVSILEREAAEFFLRSPSLEFPGAVMMELMGITEGPIHRTMERGLLGRSGDDHKRLRRLVSRSFTPRAADRWRATMREQLADLWSSLDGATSFDAMEAFARPFPSRMIALNVGAPIADALLLRGYSATIVSPFTVRIVRDEVTYRDVVFPSGTIVLVCTWSANREGRGDERPTDFDITADRGTDRPLSFGAGPHYCLGAGLAWAELEEAFAFLASKMAGLRFDGDVEWGSPIGIYDIVSLPLAFTPRPS